MSSSAHEVKVHKVVVAGVVVRKAAARPAVVGAVARVAARAAVAVRVAVTGAVGLRVVANKVAVADGVVVSKVVAGVEAHRAEAIGVATKTVARPTPAAMVAALETTTTPFPSRSPCFIVPVFTVTQSEARLDP